MSNEDRLRSLFSDLGKATLRGIRKCPKCGTYNGSRGACCKNKFCDAVFKEVGEKRKLSTEACKLITGSTAQIFSVRVRDKGPDHRGFVQLPLINTILSNDITTFISQTTALCFVDNCERSFDTSVLKCHENRLVDNIVESTCQHIQASLKCYSEAQPLTLKNSILSSLNVTNEIKREIWLLATETSGPLVQRISKNIMVVKCKASPKHPLGYLHLSFYSTRLKEKVEHGYFCSCSTFEINQKIIHENNDRSSRIDMPNRCVHFYACVCAFASDAKLSDEFQYYINFNGIELRTDSCITAEFHSIGLDKIIGIDSNASTDENHYLIFHEDAISTSDLDSKRLEINCMNLDTAILTGHIGDEIEYQHTFLKDSSIISQPVHDTIRIESDSIIDEGTMNIINTNFTANEKYDLINTVDYLLDGRDTNAVSDGPTKNIDLQTSVELFDNNAMVDVNDVAKIDDNTTTSIIYNGNNNSNSSYNNTRFINEGVVAQIDKFHVSSTKRKRDEHAWLPNINLNTLNLFESGRGKTKSQAVKELHDMDNQLDESNTNLTFMKWLASITERINQTMHFQFDGKPDPLVFHVPQIFFDCLRERLSCGGKKKRLPNSTTAFVRKDGVPLGTFIKYTWQITNILHVKSIFETPLIPLEITRSFVKNLDGTYKLYVRHQNETDRQKKNGANTFMKPLESKTYLKVGNTSPDQVEPTPFLIEWIPDILPISKIGELRIRFEFGHIHNDPLNKLDKVALSRKS